jgi:hypothetical protein
MSVVELREDTERFVLLLENPTRVYREQIEGRIENRVETQIDQFLHEVTPESALESVDKFAPPLRQLKDRGAKVRALGVWCRGDGYDLFVVQALFDKDDEGTIYSWIDEFRTRGKNLDDRFSDADHGEILEKIESWRDRNDLLVFPDPERA